MRYRWFAFGKTPELRVVVTVAVVVKPCVFIEAVARPAKVVVNRGLRVDDD